MVNEKFDKKDQKCLEVLYCLLLIKTFSIKIIYCVNFGTRFIKGPVLVSILRRCIVILHKSRIRIILVTHN